MAPTGSVRAQGLHPGILGGGPHPSVRYALTDADHLAYATRRLLRAVGWGLAVATALSVALAVANGRPQNLCIAPAVLVPLSLVGSVVWVVQRVAVRRRLRRNPLHGVALELTLRPDGLELAIPERTLVPWSLVGRPRLGRAGLEIPVQRQRWLVPRRAFATPEDARAFAAAIVAARAGRDPPATTDWPWAAAPELDAAWRTSFGDLLSLNQWLVRRPGSRNVRPRLGASLLAMGAVAGAAALSRGEPLLLPAAAVLASLGALVTPWGARLLVPVRVWVAWRRLGDYDTRLRAGPDGLHALGKVAQAVPWSVVVEIASDEDNVYLGFMGGSWWTVPARASTQPTDEIGAQLEAWRRAAAAPPRPLLPRTEPGPVDPNPFRAPVA